jgi:hypothetical protein
VTPQEQLALFPETVGTAEMPRCRHCGAPYRKGAEPDPCIGWLPDVDACCCGHGHIERAYVDPAGSWAAAGDAWPDPDRRWRILDRFRLRGKAAIEFLAARGCGPPPATDKPYNANERDEEEA